MHLEDRLRARVLHDSHSRPGVRFANDRYPEYLSDLAHFAQLGMPALDPVCAALLEFSVSLDVLGTFDTLAFVQPTSDWRDFVSHCRLPSGGHKGIGNFYQAVYGPVAATVGGVVADCEQLSFHTTPAVTQLTLQGVSRGSPTL